MDFNARVNMKLGNLVFVEIKNGAEIGKYKVNQSFYMPIKSDEIIDSVKSGNMLDKIPMSYFIEGMFFVLGADKEFRYKNIYKEMLEVTEGSEDYIKNRIFNEVKNNNYEDAFILLKGISEVREDKDIYEKMLHVIDKLRTQDKEFEDEEMRIIERSKSFDNFPTPYLYEAIVNRDKGEYLKAMQALNEYLNRGGVESKEITELKNNLGAINKFNKGKELSISEPKEALQILLPLVEIFGDSAEIYYHIAVAYRNMGIHEKAIYYLNEATGINNALSEVVNEYGINYAAIGEYNKALSHFQRAFEENRSIELCTNIIMCCMQLNDLEEVKKYIKIGESIDKDDEILIQLKQIIEK